MTGSKMMREFGKFSFARISRKFKTYLLAFFQDRTRVCWWRWSTRLHDEKTRSSWVPLSRSMQSFRNWQDSIDSRTRNSRDRSHGLSSGILPSLSRDHSSRSQARKLAVDKESQTCLQSHGFRIGKDGNWSNYAQDYVWCVSIASLHAPTALLTHSPLIRQEHRLILHRSFLILSPLNANRFWIWPFPLLYWSGRLFSTQIPLQVILQQSMPGQSES